MCLSTLVGFLQEHEYQNFLIYFWTEDAQRHVFSDSKVHKFKIESWYVFSKLMLIYFSLI